MKLFNEAQIFLITKISAHCCSFMIYSEVLFSPSAGIFQLIWKNLYETFVA